MDFKKLSAVFAVIIMMTTAFVIVTDAASEDSDADDGNVIEMVPDVDQEFQRFDQKVNWGTNNGYMYTEEIVDDLFVEYINGRSDDFLDKVVKDPKDSEHYWLYLVGYNYRDAVDFYRDSPTYVIVGPGEHTATLLSDVKYCAIGQDWNNIELKYNMESKIKYDYGMSMCVTSKGTEFENFKPVLVRFDDSVQIPESCTSITGQMTLSTKLTWYQGTYTVPAGDCWSDGTYIFKDGDPGEQRFVDEVIKGKKAIFDPADYGAITDGEFPAGTYSIYRSDFNYSWTPPDISVYLSDAGNYRLQLFQAPSDGYTLFTKPNSAMEVAISFDESKYTAFIDMGQFVYQLSSDMKYTIDTTYAAEVEIFLESVDENTPYADGDVKIEVTGVETEAGSPTGFAALCIILAALVFVVLFLSNRKPHW